MQKLKESDSEHPYTHHLDFTANTVQFLLDPVSVCPSIRSSNQIAFSAVFQNNLRIFTPKYLRQLQCPVQIVSVHSDLFW